MIATLHVVVGQPGENPVPLQKALKAAVEAGVFSSNIALAETKLAAMGSAPLPATAPTPQHHSPAHKTAKEKATKAPTPEAKPPSTPTGGSRGGGGKARKGAADVNRAGSSKKRPPPAGPEAMYASVALAEG